MVLFYKNEYGTFFWYVFFVQDCYPPRPVLCAGQLFQRLEEDATCSDRECIVLRHFPGHIHRLVHLPGHRQEDHCFVSRYFSSAEGGHCVIFAHVYNISHPEVGAFLLI